MTTRVYLDPRKLDRRVRVERQTATTDSSGGIVKTWSLLKTRWASIRGSGGKRTELTSAGGGDVPESTHEIEMHYFEGLEPTTHRLRSGDTIYEIQHVDDVYQQRVKHVISARVGVSDG